MAQALALIALLVVAFGCDDEADAVNDGATRDAVTDAALPDAALPDALGPDATPLVDAAPDPAPVTVEEAVDLVDPFVGTGGIGFGYAAETPAAMVPNGAVKLGPDTTNGGRHLHQHHFSGYHYDDPDVRGFSHLRLVGTGAGDLGLVRVRPFAARHTPMDKASEVASPGRYAVALPAVGVDVELTAAPRAGVHRYTYAAPGVLVFDAAATIEDSEPAAEVRVDGASVEGEVLHAAGFSARGGAYTVWFSAVVDPPPQGASVEGSEAVLDVSGTVEVRVGVSHVSLERARAHRDGLVGRSFDEVAEAARAARAEKVGGGRGGGGGGGAAPKRSGAPSTAPSITRTRCRHGTTKGGSTWPWTARSGPRTSPTTPTSPSGTRSARCTPGWSSPTRSWSATCCGRSSR